jgi:hypothetical protein
MMTILAQAEDAAAGTNTIEDVLAPLLMVVGVILLGFILVGSVRGKIARRQAATLSPREQIAHARDRSGAQDDAYAAGAALLDTARRLAAQLDDKAERLEQLLAEAEQRIASLDRLLEESEVMLSGAMPAEGPRDAAAGARYGREAASGRALAPSAPPADPLTTTVYELADAGRNPVEIARQLDEQIGKVELILALRGDDR